MINPNERLPTNNAHFCQVLLRNPDNGGRALVHATSWWNTDAASSNLRDPSQPIWVSLSQARKELYREIQMVQLGGSAALEEHFGKHALLLCAPACVWKLLVLCCTSRPTWGSQHRQYRPQQEAHPCSRLRMASMLCTAIHLLF